MENEQTENVAMREAFAAQNPIEKPVQDESPPVKVTGTAEELVRSLSPKGSS